MPRRFIIYYLSTFYVNLRKSQSIQTSGQHIFRRWHLFRTGAGLGMDVMMKEGYGGAVGGGF
eukprot:COSAG01_NODE_44700_length_416_cov_1.135647_1_plen_61_part_10